MSLFKRRAGNDDCYGGSNGRSGRMNDKTNGRTNCFLGDGQKARNSHRGSDKSGWKVEDQERGGNSGGLDVSKSDGGLFQEIVARLEDQTTLTESLLRERQTVGVHLGHLHGTSNVPKWKRTNVVIHDIPEP